KHFDGGRTLFTLVFRRGGRLIGVAPLLIENKRRRGLPTRQIGQLVNGCAQQSGLIVPAHKRDIFHAFYRHLQDCADQWDVVDLGGLSEASGDLPDLEAAAAVSTISAARRWQFETISLQYDGQAEDFIKSRSVNFRRKLRSAGKRLNELGSVRLRRFTSPEELESSFARLLDVECR